MKNILTITFIEEKNIGRCLNEYYYDIVSNHKLTDVCIYKLREAVTSFQSGQEFHIVKRAEKAIDGYWGYVVKVVVDSSD